MNHRFKKINCLSNVCISWKSIDFILAIEIRFVSFPKIEIVQMYCNRWTLFTYSIRMFLFSLYILEHTHKKWHSIAYAFYQISQMVFLAIRSSSEKAFGWHWFKRALAVSFMHNRNWSRKPVSSRNNIVTLELVLNFGAHIKKLERNASMHGNRVKQKKNMYKNTSGKLL